MSPSVTSLQLEGADIETPLAVVEVEEEKVELWQWLSFVICALLVTFSVPSMSFAVYKKSIQEVLALESQEIQEIVSMALIGGLFLGFIPGAVYDKFGYATTLISGGVMASSGAGLWYWLLSDGGQPGSPAWYALGFSLMLMCFGARFLYVVGMCAVLGLFPQRLVSTVSGIMAAFVTLGYVLLPRIWATFFLPSGDASTNPDAFNGLNLASLKPVSSFYFLLSVMYACITVCGLLIAGWLRPQQAKAAGSGMMQRLRSLRDPAAMAQVVLVVLLLGFISAFQTSGVAEAASQAGATPAEIADAIASMGMCGLVGRFFHGLTSDYLCNYTRVGQAGREVMSATAVSCSLLAFCLMAVAPGWWKLATYLVGFSHGGLFALSPAAIRVIFPKTEIGFWIGNLFTFMGLMSYVYGRLGAALQWNTAMYVVGSVAALLALITFLSVACIRWGPRASFVARECVKQ